MPKGAMIVAVLLALLLSGVAYLVVSKPGATVGAGKLLSDVDPAKVSVVRILQADGRTIVLTAGKGGVDWLLTSEYVGGSAGGAESASWPAATTRVRAALRLLCELDRDSTRDDVIAAGTRATRVELVSGAGTTSVEIAENSVAGKTSIVRRGVGSSSSGESFAQAFAMADVTPWREPALFALGLGECSHIEIRSVSTELSLSRVGRSWAMQRPMAANADGVTVEQTIKALASIQVSKFVGRVEASAEKAFESPAAMVTAEAERREVRGEVVLRSVIVQELRVGAPADVAGKTVLCWAFAFSRDLDTNATVPLWGPTAVVIDAAVLGAMSTEPTNYVSRASLRVPASDVFRVRFGRSDAIPTESGAARELVRNADAWKPVPGGTSDQNDERGVATLLDLLSVQRASSVSAGVPKGVALPVRVLLKSSENAEIQTMTLGIVTPPGPSGAAVLGAFDGTIYRAYDVKQGAAISAWLSQIIGK